MQHNVSKISRTVTVTTLDHIIRARVKHFNEDFFKMISTLILWCLSVQRSHVLWLPYYHCRCRSLKIDVVPLDEIMLLDLRWKSCYANLF